MLDEYDRLLPDCDSYRTRSPAEDQVARQGAKHDVEAIA